jgi:hypothetical protein
MTVQPFAVPTPLAVTGCLLTRRAAEVEFVPPAQQRPATPGYSARLSAFASCLRLVPDRTPVTTFAAWCAAPPH